MHTLWIIIKVVFIKLQFIFKMELPAVKVCIDLEGHPVILS